MRLATSSLSWKIGLTLGRYLPPRVGYALSDMIAAILTRTKSDLSWVVYTNQKAVHPEADDAYLWRVTRQVFREAGYSYYDLFYALTRKKSRNVEKVYFDPAFLEAREMGLQANRGIIIVSGHISSFDIPALAYAQRWTELQMITYPSPLSGHREQNAWRSAGGVIATPTGMPALRQAVKRLQSNGIIITGIEWPDPDAIVPVEFFGHLTKLSLGHVRLAMETGATIIPVYCLRRAPMYYEMHLMGEPLRVRPGKDRRRILKTAAEQLLPGLEGVIRQYPELWFMFHPLWSELLPTGVPHDI